jgi:hypothetical protein
VARDLGIGITVILISLDLPLRKIRCVERMRARTMREQSVQIGNLACKVVYGLAQFILSVLALKLVNGTLVAAKAFRAAAAFETQKQIR